MKGILKLGLLLLVGIPLVMISCSDDDDMITPMPEPDPGPDTTIVDPDTMVVDPDTMMIEVNIESLLINQIDELIIPSSEKYQLEMVDFLSSVEAFVNNPDAATLTSVRGAYLEANLAYQAIAVHDYYANQNVNLVSTSNLYPVSVSLLDTLIENETYNFNVTAQQRANGFPAIDYLLYGVEDIVTTFVDEPKRGAFFLALVTSMKDRADSLVDRWTGNLRGNFINNGGVEPGSAVSVQLNGSVLYYEEHIRGNKVGIPIGRLGPNDTPFDPDPTKIEGLYQSLLEESGAISLALLKASVEEMEDIYLGTTSTGEDGIGYEELLINIEHEDIDMDIKAQFQDIYDQIANRDGISGDEDLYNSIQNLVTLFKSDLFVVLNVQDADGGTDGD
ncbi:MAG: imelysin family protein [Bacteroidota bacterium]